MSIKGLAWNTRVRPRLLLRLQDQDQNSCSKSLAQNAGVRPKTAFATARLGQKANWGFKTKTPVILAQNSRVRPWLLLSKT